MITRILRKVPLNIMIQSRVEILKHVEFIEKIYPSNADILKLINMPYIVMEITVENTCSVTLN